MASQNHSFTGRTAEVINKISQAIKEIDTSAPASLRDHRRYLYLVERLGNEMRDRIGSWQGLDSRAESDSSLIAAVDRELGLAPEYHEDYEGRTTPQQSGARYGDFPDMLPAPPFMESARKLGLVLPPQYTAIPSSLPRSAARPGHHMTTEDGERHADTFSTLDAQRIQTEAGVEGRDAYLGSSQNTAVDYPSSRPKDDEGTFAGARDA